MGYFYPCSDDPLPGEQKVALCEHIAQMVAAGTAGQVPVPELSWEPSEQAAAAQVQDLKGRHTGLNAPVEQVKVFTLPTRYAAHIRGCRGEGFSELCRESEKNLRTLAEDKALVLAILIK
ncbi:Lethal giant larvae protein-like protein 1 [Camelus dromedarius]|uniref:Lethal giant larvae protein-like protein 1 n=1 Tax=Camelus dromedarius TaxID=9838 RepID=A0A5N4D6T2_CAMDR|nr:Lethal giant larvae protein-like protein 1 [Camelus dromedarius]